MTNFKTVVSLIYFKVKSHYRATQDYFLKPNICYYESQMSSPTIDIVLQTLNTDSLFELTVWSRRSLQV